MRKLTQREEVSPLVPVITKRKDHEKWTISQRESGRHLYVQKDILHFKKNMPITLENKDEAMEALRGIIRDEFLRSWRATVGVKTEQKFTIRVWSHRYVAGIGKVEHGWSTLRKIVRDERAALDLAELFMKDFSKELITKEYLTGMIMNQPTKGYFIEGITIENVVGGG
jgi:hypothetical protein